MLFPILCDIKEGAGDNLSKQSCRAKVRMDLCVLHYSRVDFYWIRMEAKQDS